MTNLLEINNLSVDFPSRRGQVSAVNKVSLAVAKGEVLGLVGESGAGKSTVGNSVINLLEPPGLISGGEIIFDGTRIDQLSNEEMRKLRGTKIGTIFQDPQTSLNPLMTIGKQLSETLIETLKISGASAREKSIELLDSVGIPDPEPRLNAYPHQFSGGMRQRVVIALALAGDPDLIIADEPTTALDVSIQKQILDLMKSLCKQRNLGVIIVTHDIGVIAEIADRVAVMYNGQLVEQGEVTQVLQKPKHDYTKSLISAVPSGDQKLHRFTVVDYIDGSTEKVTLENVSDHWLSRNKPSRTHDIAVSVKNLSIEFSIRKALFRKNRISLKAVDDVSIEIKTGESFGLVGESGSGKSTLARLIAGLYTPKSGDIDIFGHNVLQKTEKTKTSLIRRKMQMIFQDPYSSLNSRMTVEDIVSEPIRFHRSTRNKSETSVVLRDLISFVGMPSTSLRKYPHEFSGGQRQRISIARALASRPEILICDEPTSALDVSVQANILNLLKDLQEELSLTMLFISHDLPVIRQMCDRVAVMQNGRICEIAETDTLFDHPNHEYSKHLLGLMPRMDLFRL
ncbi:MAG: ABC transporter ATP-binding protein [Alphaproteobacteria bacterium TMED194]|jgi:peptide/nickel transport system ATP-binding protein|nr:MAG: ABC transporter ATP-binding protein [Alphaproteobacteria bacterium TMED194]RPH09600.1 MAG: ABC transporter ATP-binding protein [Alphaproteobacteria bacterium TMED194]|tara:strand:- start:256 stop:1959 length:1704 start_codon:yes stop_codon:yes gene_type:complete